jgi:hypothetical protein
MLPHFRQLPTSRREICDSAPALRRAVRNSGSQLLSAGQLAKGGDLNERKLCSVLSGSVTGS